MKSFFWLPALLLLMFAVQSSASIAQEEVFSGPQVGEKLPDFEAKYLRGDAAGKEFSALKAAGEKPMLLVFWHELDRPGFGLLRLLAAHAQTKSEKLASFVIALDDDQEAAKFKRTFQHLHPKQAVAVSLDGSEGPGSYGLNRNVRLTVLVAKEGKVTANFPLVQPSLNVDGKKIVHALAEALGEEKPDFEKLLAANSQRMRGGRANMRKKAGDKPESSSNRPQPGAGRGGGGDPKLDGLLRRVINKGATEEQVAAAAKAVAEYVKDNEAARKDLAKRAKLITESGKLSNYGTKAAQEVIRDWAKKYKK